MKGRKQRLSQKLYAHLSGWLSAANDEMVISQADLEAIKKDPELLNNFTDGASRSLLHGTSGVREQTQELLRMTEQEITGLNKGRRL